MPRGRVFWLFYCPLWPNMPASGDRQSATFPVHAGSLSTIRVIFSSCIPSACTKRKRYSSPCTPVPGYDDTQPQCLRNWYCHLTEASGASGNEQRFSRFCMQFFCNCLISGQPCQWDCSRNSKIKSTRHMC